MQDGLTVNRKKRLAEQVGSYLQKLSAAENQPTRFQIAIWFIILCLTLGISLSRYEAYQPGTSMDDASYIVLSRSLIYSPQYGLINFPGDPVTAKFPFGYPLLLAPVMLLFPNNLVVLQIPALIATLLNAGLLFWGWRWLYPPKSQWWGLAVTGLYALAPITIDHSRRIMSEPIFTFFCLAAIVLAERYARGQGSRWWRLGMSITLIFVVFTRTIGFVLVAVIFMGLLVRVGRKFWKEILLIPATMAVLLGLVVILTPVQVRDLLPLEYLKDENARFLTGLLTGGQKSDEPLPAAPSTSSPPVQDPTPQPSRLAVLISFGVTQHLGRDLRNIALPIGGGAAEENFWHTLGLPWLANTLGYLVSLVVIFGFIRLIRQNAGSIFLWFAVVFFGACFVWVWNDIRLLYPIQPQIQLGLLAGLEGILLWVTRLIREKRRQAFIRKYVLVGAAIFLIAASAYKSTLIEDSRLHAGDLRLRTEWLTANSCVSDIIMTEMPEIDYLYSGRQTVAYPPLSASEQLEAYLTKNSVHYILVAPKVQWQAIFDPIYSDNMTQFLPLLDELASKGGIRLAYSSDSYKVTIFQVQPES